MHAAHSYTGSGSKMSKIAIVTAIHVGLALAIINLKVVVDKDPLPPATVTFKRDKPVEPPPPPDPAPVEKLPDLAIQPPPVVPFTIEAPPPPITPPLVFPDAPPAEPIAKGQPDGVAGGTGSGNTQPAAARKAFTPHLANASDCVRPDYPARAARNGESGTVALSLLIGVDGKVADAKVQKSSGSRELDRAAIAALSMCQFKPATNNGVAEPAWGQLAYVWSLEG